jgi:hypothetical protein
MVTKKTGMYLGARVISRLALLVSVVLLLPAVSACSKSWNSAEVGTCFKERYSGTVDCSSPEAAHKLLGIVEGPSPSIRSCPNGTAIMRIDDGKGFCLGAP